MKQVVASVWSVAFLMMVAFVNGQSKPHFTKTDFYAVMRMGDEKSVNQQLDIVQKSTIADKGAYEGALLMKKAGLISAPPKKLSLFKEGHKKLEAVLLKDSNNAEYRFLRLMIQEHAPGIVGYRGDLDRDKAFIAANYASLQPEVKEAVSDYSKTSKILKPSDL